ncbi:MAG: GspE/PulE family protein [Fimbriimonas sp.]
MIAERRRIGDILIARGLITQRQLEDALDLQRLTPAPLDSILTHLGFVEEEALVDALASEYGVKPWNLRVNPPDPRAVAKLPGDVARSYKVLPVGISGETLFLAMADTEDIEALDLVRYQTRMKVEPVLTARHRLLQTIRDLHGGDVAGAGNELGNLATQAALNVKPRSAQTQVDDPSVDSAPVVGLVTQIFQDAIKAGASDIHIEPTATKIELRYRIDGRMRKMSELPASLLQALTIRIKILAELDISEHRLPMDGRIGMSFEDRKVDLRLSVVPSHHGPRMVIRILDQVRGLKQLNELGLSRENLKLFRHLITRPYGMFLVTGPTGSGKTTTLYAALIEVRDASINVITVEDPIEYEIDGVSQSQINESIGVTFDRQIIALMRQDPDVILVGEIRDEPTAQAAVRGALTGHLMLSTLQCNDAPSAIPRLMELGIDPYLLSTSLAGLSAQRLVRMLCLHCKTTRPITPEEEHIFGVYGVQAPRVMPLQEGCPECGHVGFKGRNALHEILPVTNEVSQLIASRASVEMLRAAAGKAGYVPMQHRALELVVKGATTFEEAQRVVAFDPDYGIFLGHG